MSSNHFRFKKIIYDRVDDADVKVTSTSTIAQMYIRKQNIFTEKKIHEQVNQFARQAVALRYYTQSGVNIGYCSQIAGMTEEEFIKYLGRNHISIFRFDNEKEFLEELNNA